MKKQPIGRRHRLTSAGGFDAVASSARPEGRLELNFGRRGERLINFAERGVQYPAARLIFGETNRGLLRSVPSVEIASAV
jgi:hypothetical protein